MTPGLGRTSVFAQPLSGSYQPLTSLRDQLQDQSGSYLPRLVAVLWTIFDPIQGPKVVHQVPEGSVATALSTFPTSSGGAGGVGSRTSTTNGTTTSSSSSSSSFSSLDFHTPASEGAVPFEGANGGEEGVVRSASKGPTTLAQHLFDWSSVMDFVIPKAELCGYLVTKATRTSKILGFPVQIVDEAKYHKGNETFNRNTFTFNLCFVFERDAELSVFEPLVRKIGRTLRTMEESISLLSSPPSTFSLPDLIETLYMDINAFSESSIILHDTDLDLMLFPFYKNPRDVMSWDVPVMVASLEEMKSPSWDVTLFKVCSFINGVYPVRRIAELAEVDQNLARLCIQHLLFYGAIILVDIFQYCNSYTTLPGIAEIAHYGGAEEEDESTTDLRVELEGYVYSPGIGEAPPVPFSTLLSLYSKLSPGLTVSNWIDQNGVEGFPIDVRRMIQFGVIKGFLRRCWAYPVWLGSESFFVGSAGGGANGVSGRTGRREKRRDKRRDNVRKGSRGTTGVEPALSSISSIATPAQLHDRPDLSRQTSQASSSFLSSTSSGNLSSSYTNSTLANSSSQILSPLLLTPKTPKDAPAPPQERTALTAQRAVSPSPRSNGGTGASSTGATGGGGGTDVNDRPNFPNGLLGMLDGSHHTDSICVRFGMSWRYLELVLGWIGSGGEGVFGEGQGADSGLGLGLGGMGSENSAGGAAGGVGSGTGAEGRRGSTTTTNYGSQVVLIYV